MLPRNFSNGKERSSGASLFLRLAQSASIEEVLEDLTEIAAEKGIHMYSVKVKRGRLEREFKPPNAVAVAGRIGELAVGVEGGQTHLVVRFYEHLDGAVVCELEYAAHLAAHRIEILAGGGARTDRAVTGREDRSVVIDALIGESELMAQSEPFDMYLLDTHLPDEIAFELCEQICGVPGHAPVVFISTALYEIDKQRGSQAGAIAYLTKPLDFDVLEITLTRLITQALGRGLENTGVCPTV